MNLAELLKLKFPLADFMSDIILCDHGLGKGVEIQKWSLDGVPRPSISTLAQWRTEVRFAYRTQLALNARVYPDIRDQLDMLYHDKINGTDNWVLTVAAIKEAHPKPLI